MRIIIYLMVVFSLLVSSVSGQTANKAGVKKQTAGKTVVKKSAPKQTVKKAKASKTKKSAAQRRKAGKKALPKTQSIQMKKSLKAKEVENRIDQKNAYLKAREKAIEEKKQKKNNSDNVQW